MIITFPESIINNIQNLTKEDILDNISDEEIMKKYLGLNESYSGGLFTSPLRKDTHPTCSLYRNKDGVLFFKDFGNGDHLNCFGVVMKLYNCNFNTALNIIYNDFKLNLTQSRSTVINHIEKKEILDIRVEIQPFSKKELDWWNQYGINEQLLSCYNVFSCRTVFINSKIAFANNSKLAFGYYNGVIDGFERWRIYFPTNKSYRFLGNWDKNMVQGYSQLQYCSDFIVITKSMKDVMCLRSLGIEAIAPNSEMYFIPESIYKKLEKKYKYILLLYDNDLAGVQGANKIHKEYKNIIPLIIPRKFNAKDISDFRKLYGQEGTKKLIFQTKRWLRSKV